MNPIFAYNSYFFHPNKWPIGKAPKVSSSSYQVGFGFLFMFHAYAYPALDNFTLFTYNWFTFNFQLTSPLFLVFYFLTFRYRSLFYLAFFCAVAFFFFFFGSSVKSSRFFKRNFILSSNHLVLNWDALLFVFFLLAGSLRLLKNTRLKAIPYRKVFSTKQRCLLFTFLSFSPLASH